LAGSPLIWAVFLVVLRWAPVGSLTVHAGSGAWQAPSVEVTTFVIWLVSCGRVLPTVTVKWTVALPASLALAAGTATTWVQGVPAGEAGAGTQGGPQPSPPSPL